MLYGGYNINIINMKKILIVIIVFIASISYKVFALSDEAYQIGDQVTYKDIDFYVIADCASDCEYLTMLKAEPLSYDETVKYGSTSTYQTNKGYGGVIFETDYQANIGYYNM